MPDNFDFRNEDGTETDWDKAFDCICALPPSRETADVLYDLLTSYDLLPPRFYKLYFELAEKGFADGKRSAQLLEQLSRNLDSEYYSLCGFSDDR